MRNDGELPERFQEPRTEQEEAEYFIEEKGREMTLGRIKGCLSESQLRVFASELNRRGANEPELFEAISERIDELQKYR